MRLELALDAAQKQELQQEEFGKLKSYAKRLKKTVTRMQQQEELSSADQVRWRVGGCVGGHTHTTHTAHTAHTSHLTQL